jgi:ATP-dependent 26S proteasome regulatory subunit
MFDINMKELKIAKTIKWEKIIEMTKGHSGADICNVCRDAAYMPMRRKLNSIGGIKKLENLKQ